MSVILYRDSAGEYGWVSLSHGIPSEWRKERGFKEVGVFDSPDAARQHCRKYGLRINSIQDK